MPGEIELALEIARKLSSEGGQVATFAVEIVNLLELAIGKLSEIERPAVVTRAGKNGGGTIEYAVERVKSVDEVLVERRTTGTSKPFRCSKTLYDAVAAVLGDSEKPISVGDIADAVGQTVGDRPEEFRVRVVLRLWTTDDLPLVSRSRARYRAIERLRFEEDAANLWDRLRSRTK
jgi:hypothetical protein